MRKILIALLLNKISPESARKILLIIFRSVVLVVSIEVCKFTPKSNELCGRWKSVSNRFRAKI